MAVALVFTALCPKVCFVLQDLFFQNKQYQFIFEFIIFNN